MPADGPAADPLTLLSRALDQAGVVIAGVRDDQATLPTPCRSWDVAALIRHLVHVTRKFAVRAAGGTPDWTAPEPELDTGGAAAFRAEAAALLAAWRDAGDLTGTVKLPGMGEMPARFPVDQQITELAVHTWDLTRATGRAVDLDPEVGKAALSWAKSALRPEFRGEETAGKAFGAEVEIADGAPVYDRLAAFFGRDPG